MEGSVEGVNIYASIATNCTASTKPNHRDFTRAIGAIQGDAAVTCTQFVHVHFCPWSTLLQHSSSPYLRITRQQRAARRPGSRRGARGPASRAAGTPLHPARAPRSTAVIRAFLTASEALDVPMRHARTDDSPPPLRRSWPLHLHASHMSVSFMILCQSEHACHAFLVPGRGTRCQP
jgi:hypothetical protein